MSPSSRSRLELARPSQIALVVDLDATLVQSDTTHDALASVILRKPIRALALLPSLIKNKARFKSRLAQLAATDAATLIYNQSVLEVIAEAKRDGRKVILATASDISTANSVAKHLAVFDAVIATDSDRNLIGSAKAEAIAELLGGEPFEYAGDSEQDLKVWTRAQRVIVVNPDKSLKKKMASAGLNDPQLLGASKSALVAWLRAMRLYQWAKNLLLLLPVFAAHVSFTPVLGLKLVFALLAFGFTASSVYMLNDIVDLNADRLHPRKSKRAFASGRLSPLAGLIAVPLMLLVGFAFALQVNLGFVIVLLAYLAITFFYSFWLKRIAIADVFVLTLLYTLRVFAGAAVIEVKLSFWLIAFSLFLFLSLAFVKRYAELAIAERLGGKLLPGRGYKPQDAPLVMSFGVASGFASVLVLALYTNSDAVIGLYRAPETMLFALPVLLFWITWVWFQASRGKMHDDPLIFAMTDRFSQISALAITVIFVLASIGI